MVRRIAYAGQYVKEGDPLFELGDFSTMWLKFDAYERDLAWLKPGAVDRETQGVFDMVPRDVKLYVYTNTAATSMMENPNFDISSFDREKRPGILENRKPNVRLLLTSMVEAMRAGSRPEPLNN